MSAPSTAIAGREEQAVVVSETAAILSMIERAARDPTVDIEKFERLMAMRERVENRSREDAFTAAMSATQAELPQVVRDAKNDHTKSDYATLEAISQAITPVYTKHGFSLSFGTEQSPLPSHHRITCIVSAFGHSRQYGADLPADVAGSQGKVNKTAIQAFGSTMSYGRRYLTLLIFNVAMKGEDDDGNAAGGPETISEDQAVELIDALEAIAESTKLDVAATRKNFCAALKIKSIGDLPAARFEEAKALLAQRRAAK